MTKMTKALSSNYFVSADIKGSPEETLEQGGEWVGQMEVSSQPQPSIEVSRGETVNMGDFESARVDVGLIAFGFIDEQEALYEECQRIVDLLLSFEVTKLRAARSKVKTQPPEIEWKGPQVDLVILTYKYGLTLNLGDYQSARADVGRSYPCSPLQLATHVRSMQDWLRAKIVVAKTHIMNKNKNKGDGDVGV